ncbi:hypothetical protein [Arenimonas oryziterrae]|uniref:Lipoprotein n=1 Tax=Arenimonas oryziterrae DSM 21050 = YC6267 TaxID=1121015 RepID=A0A091AZW7_9GAMM|nr:hypothetical protein [Arenimonas oryziterrae]KFN44194.1 hypothetical protein N789_07190 [Arenimonas oryziterrae DSM 21050 = YC6267]
MKTLTALLLSACLAVSLTGCAGGPAKPRSADYALFDYNGAIRWSEFEQAYAFVDPAIRAEHPMTDLERERFKQVQITGYEVKLHDDSTPGVIEQTVEIRLIGKLTQAERVIVDHQRWRWDATAKRWWLISGLPDVSGN